MVESLNVSLNDQSSSSPSRSSGGFGPRQRQWIILGIVALIVVIVVVVPTSVILSQNDDNDDNNNSVPAYQIWCTGNCNTDVSTVTQTGVVLMGGGEDVDQAFTWQIANANGGDFVVIRTDGSDGYNDYINDLAIASNHPLNSIRTIRFNARSASYDTTVLSYLQDAEAIFIAGGDQSVYLQTWQNTPVQTTLNQKLQTVTIGGTSAGCMVLGKWIYQGSGDSILTSEEAMTNPYDPQVVIDTNFLNIPYLENVLADTHFVRRNRMGRTLTFTARVLADYNVNIERGFGIDENTAFLLNATTGLATTVGSGTAYICNSTHPAEVCQANVPLTFMNISCVRLNATTSDQYSFKTWSGTGVQYINTIINGNFTTAPYGPNGPLV